MQYVADKFYVWYNRLMGTLGFLYMAATILAWTIPSLNFLQEEWGFHPIIGFIGFVQVMYSMFLFRRQSNLWVSCLTGAMIFTLLHIGLTHNSGQFHSWFLIAWFTQVFIAGIFGLYSLVGCCFMITIYYVLLATGPFGEQSLNDPFTYGALLITYFVATISYAFWRRKYIDVESKRINQLTGQLQGNQQQSEILIQSIADGVIVTDTEGRITLLNPAAAKMTGWEVNEAVNIDVKTVVNLQTEEGKEIVEKVSPFHQVLQNKTPYNATLRLVNRDNSFAIVSMVISPVVLPKTEEFLGAVAVFRDVSAARAEENRRADFISTASHEMRTPVAAIEGYLALALNDKVSQIDSKARSYLTKAHESTQRLGKLFQDLLTSAKAEDGRLVNHPKVVEMGDFLQELTDGLRFTAEKKGLLMDFTVGAPSEGKAAGTKVIKPLYYTFIDPDRMREVVTNLFDNAVKYTETGKITIALTGNDKVVQLFVKDTGPGIPEADVPHLFQKFYRVDNTATRTIGGTGLGLFICRKIIDLYKGRIWVESQLGQGSTFYINLPRLSNQAASEMEKTQNTEGSTS